MQEKWSNLLLSHGAKIFWCCYFSETFPHIWAYERMYASRACQGVLCRNELLSQVGPMGELHLLAGMQ